MFGMGTGVAPPESPPGMSECTNALTRICPDRSHESDYCTSRDGLRSTAPKTGHGVRITGSIQLPLEASPRPISTARLSLSALHLRPINLVVSQGTYPLNAVGDLILGWVSRLDAFSAYPVRT